MGQACSPCNNDIDQVKAELQSIDPISNTEELETNQDADFLQLHKDGSWPSSSSGKAPEEEDPKFQEEVLELQKFCRAGALLEAMRLLETLEQRMKQKGQQLPAFFRSDQIQRLREIRDRRASYLKRLVEPAWKDGQSWATIELTDPEVSPDFKMVMRMRFARGSERSAAGGSQVVIGTHAEGFPLPLTKFIAFHSQTKHLQKEWIKDCEKLIGRSATTDNIYTALVISLLAPKILPWNLEDVILRNFVVYKEAPPLKNGRPGVMVMESSPPEGATQCNGVDIPQPRRGVLQILGSEKLNFIMPSKLGTDSVDVISSVRIQIPVPQWLVNLELIKRFLADLFTNSLKNIKQKVIGQWDKLEFDDEILRDPDFFSQVEAIVDAAKKSAQETAG